MKRPSIGSWRSVGMVMWCLVEYRLLLLCGDRYCAVPIECSVVEYRRGAFSCDGDCDCYYF